MPLHSNGPVSVDGITYASAAAAARALKGEGFGPTEIARMIGVPRSSICAAVYGRRGKTLVHLRPDVAEALMPLACERGETVAQVARRLLEALACEPVIAANLLDDTP